jgi:hypothetical protein
LNKKSIAKAALRLVRISGLILRVWDFIAPPGIGIEKQVNPRAQIHLAQDLAHRFALVNAVAQWILPFSLVFIGASIRLAAACISFANSLDPSV